MHGFDVHNFLYRIIKFGPWVWFPDLKGGAIWPYSENVLNRGKSFCLLPYIFEKYLKLIAWF